MGKYVLKRVLISVFTLLVITLVLFKPLNTLFETATRKLKRVE